MSKLTFYKFANMNLLCLSLARVWRRLPHTVVQAFRCTAVLGHGEGCRPSVLGTDLAKPHTSPGKRVLFLIHRKARVGQRVPDVIVL